MLLRADRYARSAYRQMQNDPQFQQPKRYDALRVDDYDALLLPGGHAKRVKAYLENPALQAFVADFFEARSAAGQAKPVAAICHGVVLAARAKSKTTGKSVLHGRKTTALTWQLERSAWHLTKYFARFWDPDYYRTYRESGSEAPGYWGVEQEIRRALASAADFVDVPADAAHRFRKASGMLRDRIDDARPPGWCATAITSRRAGRAMRIPGRGNSSRCSMNSKGSAMILGLRTAIYPAPDLQAAKEWYEQVLKRKPYFDQPFYVGFAVGGFELGLVPDGEPGVAGAQALWGVANVDVTFARLLELGASVLEPVTAVGDASAWRR